MGKLPFIQFYPLDWLRDTGGLSPLAKAVWIDILAYAWNEPERGIYVRSREAFCSQLRIDQKDLLSVLSELTSVAVVTASNEKVTVLSRRMFKYESALKSNRIRQKRFYYNARPNTNLTPQTLDVKEKERRKDVDVTTQQHQETAVKRQKDFTVSPAKAIPKGLTLGPTTEANQTPKPEVQSPKTLPPQTALLAKDPPRLTPQEQEAYIERVRAKLRRKLEFPKWEDI